MQELTKHAIASAIFADVLEPDSHLYQTAPFEVVSEESLTLQIRIRTASGPRYFIIKVSEPL